MAPVNPQPAAPSKAAVQAPALTLPKGGGAIRGIGEKFAANPATGTGSFSVPIFTSPGRSEFALGLLLSYDSGAGNGPFGFGWTLGGVPAIKRKTDQGLPQYFDQNESDVFLLGGAEDLVPVPGDEVIDGFIVRRYRPRVEQQFARIERWTRAADPRDIHWRMLSKHNVLSVFGGNADSRIADPDDPGRIYSWLIDELRDDKGNAVLYRYKVDDGAGVDPGAAHEQHRGGADAARRRVNRYPKSIYYGNRSPLLDETGNRPRFLNQQQIADQIATAGWMFQVVFDYGEHDAAAPAPDDAGAWPFRTDPFSSYRSGFEVRTTRLCRRVLLFHHFPGAADVGRECLVASTDFSYSDGSDSESGNYSVLTAVAATRYRRGASGYEARGLPPLEFDYTRAVVQSAVHDVDPSSLENVTLGADSRWTDLHGEGIPGILTEQGGAWFYTRNVSPISDRPVELAPLERVSTRPSVDLRSTRAEFMDLGGRGRGDLVVMDGPAPGIYAHDEAEGWDPFRPLLSQISTDLRSANVKFVDLDGDGRADVLITEDDAIVWHPSLGDDGFGPARRVALALDEEHGPRLLLADGTQSVYLADMSGDGLTDLVRVRNGEVCYWPNLGYGRFGAKVTMDRAPWFDTPDQFDQRRIRLADIDGSGPSDLVYLHGDGPRLYFNQSGNGWSDPCALDGFPAIDNMAAIQVADLFGNGTACLVWSSPRPDLQRRLRYVDLMGGEKPHLLIGIVNNLGAETRVHYVSSTTFYLDDRRKGRPWITKLPFPVHVVDRVESFDYVSRSRFVCRYAYHHGHFDGDEREFRGFGMVEQWDTEQLAALVNSNAFPGGDNIDASSHVPPVYTRTWFHTGAYLGRERIADVFAGSPSAGTRGEYFREPGLTDAEARELLLATTVLPPSLTPDEEREACRALKGSLLRQETYALDGSGREPYPYKVVENTFAIRLLQARAANRHGVFVSHPRESITFNYERDPADPRIQHVLTLDVDDFGNVLKRAEVGYGRRTTIRAVDAQGAAQQISNPALAALAAADRLKQTANLITYTDTQVTNAVDSTAVYRTPLPCEARTFELTGYAPTGPVGRFRAADFVEPDPASPGRLRHVFLEDIAYEETANGHQARRPIKWEQTLYRRDDLTAALPLGALESLALLAERRALAFTPGLLAKVFQRQGEALLPDPVAVLGSQGNDGGGYVTNAADGQWWSIGLREFFTIDAGDDAAVERAAARQHFFLPRRYRDAFAQDTLVAFDADDLLVVETRDALGNRVTAPERDYRVLQPRVISDPNGNRNAVTFDVLGMVAGTAVMGKPSPAPVEGDSLDGFTTELTETQIDGFHEAADPGVLAAALLGDATTRVVSDYDRFWRTRKANPADPAKWLPAFAATLSRETHVGDPLPPAGLRIRIVVGYFDGLGREIQKKVPGDAGPLAPGAPDVAPRWIGEGWTIFNNKGKPVRKYEPFFTATHRFEFGVLAGVSPVLFYDPAERVVAKLHPNHSYEKLVIGPWRQDAYDANDTAAPRNAQTGDPRSDADVGGYVAAYFRALPDDPANLWQTWHQQRVGGALGPEEQDAAAKTAAHADTPTTRHLDVLGRAFLTVSRNRVVCANHPLDGTEAELAEGVDLDVDGRQLAVRDAITTDAAAGRIVVRYAYDMLGRRIRHDSMDAGTRWMLEDVGAKQIRAWDDRGHTVVTFYDLLRRRVHQVVRGATAASDPRTLDTDILFDRIEYGEGQPDAEALNLRMQVFRHFDSAGVTTHAARNPDGGQLEAYDFKGNLLRSSRQLLGDYRSAPDWSSDPALEADVHVTSTVFDALNRRVMVTAPDGSVMHHVYDAGNKLAGIRARVRGASPVTTFVDDIDYNAKGQRERVVYGNGATTQYKYDPLTFRLTHLQTMRPGDVLQELSYVFDPVGNVTQIHDAAQQTIYFRNRRVAPDTRYCYDAVYRLIEARGREHLGQGGGAVLPPAPGSYNDRPRTRLFHPGDGNAMATYIERYVHDAAGNFVDVTHRGSDPSAPGWTRGYQYNDASLIEPARVSNRLTRTLLDGADAFAESYAHDAHGNMSAMPHLQEMAWDFKDRLMRTGRQQVNAQDDEGAARQGERTYYTYDGDGHRVRKVTERVDGQIKEQRLYLDGLETYRGSGTDPVVRETLHVMDDKQRLAMVETRTGGADGSPAQLTRYQFGNHLSSVSLELDEQADVISYEEYMPCGSTSYQAVRSQTETPKRYRFSGKERDEESGLGYHEARYYASWIGRWTAADPKGLRDGVNVYAYVLKNAIKATDPTGTQSKPQTPNQQVEWRKDAGDGNLTQYARSLTPERLGQLLADTTGPASDRLLKTISKAKLTVVFPEMKIGGTPPVRTGTTTVTSPAPSAVKEPPTLGQDYNEETAKKVVQFYLEAAIPSKPKNRQAQVDLALDFLILDRNKVTGGGKDLNYAAADHFLNNYATTFQLGAVGLITAPTAMWAWDIVKYPTVVWLDINPNFMDPDSQTPSDPDSRVRDWARVGAAAGRADAQLEEMLGEFNFKPKRLPPITKAENITRSHFLHEIVAGE